MINSSPNPNIHSNRKTLNTNVVMYSNSSTKFKKLLWQEDGKQERVLGDVIREMERSR